MSTPRSQDTPRPSQMHIKTLRNQQKLSAGSLPFSSSRPPVDPGSARHLKSVPSRPVRLFPDRPPGDIDAPAGGVVGSGFERRQR
jgi:hypothetical protein